jgi:hypothetical protein
MLEIQIKNCDDDRMKNAVLVAAVLLSAAPALAKHGRRPADPRVAWVDDEPMSAAVAVAAKPVRAPVAAPAKREVDLSSTGDLRTIQFAVPTATRIVDDAAPAAEHVEVAVEPERSATEPVVSGVVEELAARQMRRHQASIDACTAAAARRSPSLKGTVALELVIGERKVVYAEIASDTTHDITLEKCLLKTAEGWSFALSHASFTWPVVLTPSPSEVAAR